MGGELIKIDCERDPVPEVIEALERILEMAKAGRVRGVGIVVAADALCDGSLYALGQGTIAQLVTGCERLKLRLLTDGEG